MPQILIDNWSEGEYTSPAKTQVPNGGALKAANVKFDRFGNLTKQKGTDKVEDAPSGITTVSGCEIEFTKPSTQKIKIIYGTDAASRDTLWWKPYWNPVTEAWVDSWQELTEFEGPYVMNNIAGGAAGDTDDNDVYDLSSLDSTTDDYYNEWLLLNLTLFKSMVVDDYDGTNRKLILKNDITGQLVDDKYMLYRFPLIKSLEGENLVDAGSSTTTIIDTELRADINDYYVGWKLYNDNRHATLDNAVTITAYDAKTKTLTHPTITSQTTNDRYIVWKETHNIRVEDFVRFFPRENAVEMSLGNDEPYPLKAPLWFGYISEREYFSPSAFNDTTFKGFWLTRNVMEKPDESMVNPTDKGSGTLVDDRYDFRLSYIYDGYQESPLSAKDGINPAGSNAIEVELIVPLYYSDDSNKPGIYAPMLDRRITHIRLYASKSVSGDLADDYFLIMEMPVTSLGLVEEAITQWKADGGGVDGLYDLIGDVDFDDDIWVNGIVDTFTQSKVQIAKFNRWDTNQGHKSKSVDANFKYRASLEDQHFVAPIHTDEQRNAAVGYSVETNGSGVPVDDVIPHENYLLFSQKGVTKVTGLFEIAGFLYVTSEIKTFRYAQGRSLFETFQERGLVAPDGLEIVDDIAYIPAKEDVYAFNGNEFKPLMFGRILDQWEAISIANKQNAISGYQKLTNTYWLQAGSSRFIYEINYGSWRRREIDVTPVWYFKGVDGELFVATSGAIYELDSSTWDEDITIDHQSKVYDITKQVNGRTIPINGIFNDLILKYKSDNEITLEIYDLSYSTTYPKRKLTFLPQTTMKPSTPRELNFEAGEVQFKITDVNQGSQPTVEIDWLKADFDEVTS